jgi:TatD DNase family protein
MLVDAHAHLDLLSGAEEEIRRARSLGVLAVIGVSMGAASMERTMRLGEAFPGVVLPALGLHPWQIDRENPEEVFARMEENLERAVAIGEIGLDYKIKTRKSIQKDWFVKQLHLATQKALPVIVHCRYSHQRAVQLVEEADVPRAVYHWYSGPLELIDRIADRGDFVSATPALAYSRMHQEAIRSVPMDNLLLETDSPVAYEGEEARPSTVLRVCRQVASLKGRSSEEVARRTTENARRFLGRSWRERPDDGDNEFLEKPTDE